MKTENNPYFKNTYKKPTLWKATLYFFAIPFLYILMGLLKILIGCILFFKWFKSVFTNTPIATGKKDLSYWVKGKKISFSKGIELLCKIDENKSNFNNLKNEYNGSSSKAEQTEREKRRSPGQGICLN